MGISRELEQANAPVLQKGKQDVLRHYRSGNLT